MTPVDYDDRARRWLAGDLEPSVGRDAWEANARADTKAILAILAPYRCRTLLEVGSGFGRLTPHLAAYYDHVIAVDTSPGMQQCTELACAECVNVSVRDHRVGEPYPVADCALVNDVIDGDWSLQEADELVDAVLRSCLVALVSVKRLAGWAPWGGAIVREGDGWWLLQAESV